MVVATPARWGGRGRATKRTSRSNVARRLRRVLETRGQHVILTRDSDRDVDIYPRSVVSNDNACDFCSSASIATRAAWAGMALRRFYAANGDEADYGLAKSVYDAAALAFADHQGRGIKTDTTSQHEAGLGVLRNTRAPACLIELEFIDVPAQYAFLTDPAVQERYAAALADGLLSYVPALVPPSPVAGTEPTIIGSASPTNRQVVWEYLARGAAEYRTRYRQGSDPFSNWTPWGTETRFAITLGTAYASASCRGPGPRSRRRHRSHRIRTRAGWRCRTARPRRPSPTPSL